MSMPKKICLLWVLLSLGWAGNATAGLILDITSSDGTATSCSGGCSAAGTTYGWAFTVNSPITVDGLGIWDFDADGIGPDVTAGLWLDGGALLASAVISSSSALEFTNSAGGWRFEDIVELVLEPGNYVIGAANYPNTPSAYVDPAFATIAEVTYTGSRFHTFAGQGLVRPDGAFFLDIFGPNLRLAESAEIPIPTTLFLLGLGLAAFTFSRRKRKRIS
jgi:hypothetical protein